MAMMQGVDPTDGVRRSAGDADGMARRPNYTAAIRAADELTVSYSEPPIPVLEIADRCGVKVIFADFDKFRREVAGLCDFRASEILVNREDATTRQMFTIAHELGHWVLHRDYFRLHPERYPVLPRLQQVVDKNPFEQEANTFAANLLVPKRLLVPLIGVPVATLARIFAVSQQMMEFRIRDVRR